MNGASQQVSGGANGPVVYASVSFTFYPLCSRLTSADRQKDVNDDEMSNTEADCSDLLREEMLGDALEKKVENEEGINEDRWRDSKVNECLIAKCMKYSIELDHSNCVPQNQQRRRQQQHQRKQPF